MANDTAIDSPQDRTEPQKNSQPVELTKHVVRLHCTLIGRMPLCPFVYFVPFLTLLSDCLSQHSAPSATADLLAENISCATAGSVSCPKLLEDRCFIGYEGLKLLTIRRSRHQRGTFWMRHLRPTLSSSRCLSAALDWRLRCPGRFPEPIPLPFPSGLNG